jgi:general stress protein 26
MNETPVGNLDQNTLKDLLLDFMASHPLCVIATVGQDSKPESAIVGFTNTERLELIIGTSNKSRKYANLIQNPHVSIVIGDETGEIQYEGDVEILPNGEYRNMVEEAHIAKLPGAAEYREDPSQVYMKVHPTWIRFLKHGANGGLQEYTEIES